MDYTKLNELLQALPGYALISDTMRDSALASAQVPDSEGRWPGSSDYEKTYDLYYAALALVPFLQAQPAVTSAGSEGTSVTATAFDWQALIRFYRSQSQIHQSAGQTILQVLPIPDPPHVVRVPMNDRGGYYGDVDTDIG